MKKRGLFSLQTRRLKLPDQVTPIWLASAKHFTMDRHHKGKHGDRLAREGAREDLISFYSNPLWREWWLMPPSAVPPLPDYPTSRHSLKGFATTVEISPQRSYLCLKANTAQLRWRRLVWLDFRDLVPSRFKCSWPMGCLSCGLWLKFFDPLVKIAKLDLCGKPSWMSEAHPPWFGEQAGPCEYLCCF